MKKLRTVWVGGPMLALLLFAACRSDERTRQPSIPVEVTYPDPDPGEIKGFFVLNEGNMGSNKASLDYFDYGTGVYTRNIFAERNPEVVGELGDVGNDIQIYRDRIYAVINCSNFVEVMDVRTARHIGVVSIPNCRYIAFEDGYAYVTSYAGPVQVDPNARPGYVAKVDLETLTVVGECVVGYQPDGLVVAGDKLYVANSGGYRPPEYDRTVSVIDLESFTEVRKIEVGVNPGLLELDRYGTIWVASRGDLLDVPSKLFTIDSATDEVTGSFEVPVGNMTRRGDSLYVHSYGRDYATAGEGSGVSYAIVNTKTRRVVTRNFIADGTEREIKIPYGLAVNRATGELFVSDARDYVTPGRLHCYSPQGVRRWSVTTGDIPAHIAFTTVKLQDVDDPGTDPPEQPDGSAYVTEVIEYVPAPGQFVNLLPEYTEGDTRQTMNRKALEMIGGNRRGVISLGGWGGYVVVGFDHTIRNVAGKRDFRVLSNAFYAEENPTPAQGGSSEPGIIMVARDVNENGRPDPDEWYEIEGSAHRDPASESWYGLAQTAGNEVETIAGYEVTYHRPEREPDSPAEWPAYIRWEDNRGETGWRAKNAFHRQPYYPQWVEDDRLTFGGTRLPQNSVDESGTGVYFVFHRFGWGYADNAPNADEGSTIDIDWAVDDRGRPANLTGIDFIKIYTGVSQQSGRLGESSSEIMGVEDLHILGIDIDTTR